MILWGRQKTLMGLSQFGPNEKKKKKKKSPPYPKTGYWADPQHANTTVPIAYRAGSVVSVKWSTRWKR